MTTFALVHGAWHGAWCFERLVTALEARGHRAVAVDLPCERPAGTFATYADAVIAALPAEPAVVVGHSLAGHTIPLVAARVPVAQLVYLCALPAAPGHSFVEAVDGAFLPEYQAGLSAPDEFGRRQWVDEDVARKVLYADCDPADARAAFRSLRPQASALYRLPCPLDALPDVPATSIVCRDDRIVDPEWSREVARGRLDAELFELPGSHSPFLSRPEALADVLVGLV